MQPTPSTLSRDPLSLSEGPKPRPAGILDPSERTSKGGVIELRLSADQEEVLAPLIRTAAAER